MTEREQTAAVSDPTAEDVAATATLGNSLSVLVASGQANARRTLALALLSDGCHVLTAGNEEAALSIVGTTDLDVMLLDAALMGERAAVFLGQVHQCRPDLTVLMMAHIHDMDRATGALQHGAHDVVVVAPGHEELLRHAVRRAATCGALRERVRDLERRVSATDARETPVFRSAEMRKALGRASGVAATSVGVLLVGEPGTGRRTLARFIHGRSLRAHRSLAEIDCAAMPSHVGAAELCGSETHAGLLRDPGVGTVYVDGVHKLRPLGQASLLQRLVEREMSVGEVPRVVFGASPDLFERVRRGDFARDLFLRLGVVIHLPPLRRRRDDIPLLAHHFARRFAEHMGRRVRLSSDALSVLRAQPWPGNVTQLEKTIEGAVALARGEKITPKDLGLEPETLSWEGARAREAPELRIDLADLEYAEAKRRIVRRFEREYAASVLATSGGNVSQAARRAGLDRSNFRRILKKARAP